MLDASACLRRVVAVARVNIHLRHIRFNTNPVPFSGCSRFGRPISDQVLFAEGLTRFDNGVSRLSIVAYSELLSTGLIRKAFEHVGPLALLPLVAWFPGETWTEWDCVG